MTRTSSRTCSARWTTPTWRSPARSPSASSGSSTRDFTQEQGQLSAKQGIRRSVLAKEFASDIEALYS